MVLPMRSICIATRYTSPLLGASFLAISRSGIDLLHVRIAGCGRRADISIEGGVAKLASADEDGFEGPPTEGGGCGVVLLPKNEVRFLVDGGAVEGGVRGAKANGRLAYAS